jgi:hypothetical protein
MSGWRNTNITAVAICPQRLSLALYPHSEVQVTQVGRVQSPAARTCMSDRVLGIWTGLHVVASRMRVFTERHGAQPFIVDLGRYILWKTSCPAPR